MKVNEFNAKKKYSEVSGATALVDPNIKIAYNQYGQYEEIISDPLVKELNTAVPEVSPNLNAHVSETVIAEKLYKPIEGIKFHARLGYYRSLYAGHVSEGDYREHASSGGMGTWIFKELFDKDLIDGVIHVKENKETSGPLFKYDISRTLKEIREGAKTRYYPVEFSDVLRTVRDKPGRYAIIGIPSFIMSVRLLAEKDEILKERIKYTVGLICGHQKSSQFADAIAWQVGIKPGDLKSINFRKKLLDKPANNYGVEMTGLVDGKLMTIVKPTKELLGQNWGQGYFKKQASDFTDDVMNETADITLGDAWLPEYTKDSKGNNVVIVRDPRIEALIENGIEEGRLNLDRVNSNIIIRSQSSHIRHTQDELTYRLYKKDKQNEWRPAKRVQPGNSIPFLRKKVQDLREEISQQSHVIFNEAVKRDDLNYFTTEMGKLTKRYNFLYRLIAWQNKGVKGLAKSVLRRLK